MMSSATDLWSKSRIPDCIVSTKRRTVSSYTMMFWQGECARDHGRTILNCRLSISTVAEYRSLPSCL